VSAVVARDLFRVYSTPEGDAAALQGLTLNVGEGEVLAVLGPSGAGKSTLLRLLAGLDRPSAGELRVFGLDLPSVGVRALARHRAQTVGCVEQNYVAALDPTLAIRDSIALRLHLDADRSAASRAHELLESVGLAERAHARPGELSGGEQQRIAVCAALAHRPRLLLADEPTGELDRAAADTVFALIRDLSHRNGATAVVVSHDPRAAAFADRAIGIRDGRVSEERRGSTERIVVARGGWVRLPEELLRGARIGERIEARLRGSEIVITAPDGGDGSVAVSAEAAPLPARPETVLRLRDVDKAYGARSVLRGLDADVRRGVLTVVTGPSGSGKTTLLSIATGLELPDRGTVELAGSELTRLDRTARASVRAEHVGFVAQQPPLIGFLSARENVELTLRIRRRRADALAGLEAVGLAERAEQRVERLSHGEKLRVAIARGFAARPAVLVADEPTSRLDEANARNVTSLLAELAREWRAAVLVASHDRAVIEQADVRIDL
jgi:ABC-type lipoprotein export system ATPase subunit